MMKSNNYRKKRTDPKKRLCARVAHSGRGLNAKERGTDPAAGTGCASARARAAENTWVERFGRRRTEQNELLRSEFGENSWKIHEAYYFVAL